MSIVVARYQWTEEDLANGRKYFLRSKPVARWQSAVIIVGCSAYVLWDPIIDGRLETWFTLPVLVIIATFMFLLIPRIFSSWFRKREFAKRPDADQLIEMIFSEEGVVTTSPTARSESRWPAFHKMIHTPGGFFLLPNEQIFYFIPNRAFGSAKEIEDLKTLSRQNAKEYREMR